ncbi:MAG: hypothetical protein ABGY75_05025 [Gemmataceae bacterium]
MSRALNLPRWAYVPLCLVVCVGLIWVSYPGGLAAACRDVQDSGELNEQIATAQHRSEELSGRTLQVADRIAVKEALVTRLVSGELSLNEAAAQFAELNASEPIKVTALRWRYGDLSDDELAARSVIEYVDSRGLPNRTQVLDRLDRQYQARFGHRPNP